MSNPVLNTERWESDQGHSTTRAMTVGGAINKTFLLIGIMLVTIGMMWAKYWSEIASLSVAATSSGLSTALLATSIAPTRIVLSASSRMSAVHQSAQ